MKLNTAINSNESTSKTCFTNNFNYLLKSKNMNCMDLSKIIGGSPEQLHYLKTGKLANPTLRVLLGIKEHFNVSIDDLICTDMSKAAASQ